MSIKPKIRLNLLGALFLIYCLLATGKVYAVKFSDPVELLKQENIFFGAVKDTANLPLQGVSVYVKGNPKVGTTTDEKGQFRLPTTETNVTLVFRYVGYQVRELINPSKTAINITLQPDESQLSEVVIVGYGTQKKESVTGAISTVSSNDLSRSVATTTSGALVGKIAGVNSRMPDGRPGAATNISIRNMGNPLYVIDGVQKDASQFNNLDFNDIESISVLKDASAAIYGVRAANGVIVVTTKKGKRGDNNSFNINSYYGLQHMFRYPKPADISTYISSYIQSDAIAGVADPLYTKEDLAK